MESKNTESNLIKTQLIESIRPLNARFVKSSVGFKDSIPAECAEVAILGRSNVGKSSFINTLLNHKLAKSSSTPGKTRLINFFKVDFEVKILDFDTDSKNLIESNLQDSTKFIESNSKNSIKNIESSPCKNADSKQSQTLKIPLIIIDFPGFGYAKVDKKTRDLWDKNLSDFLAKRLSVKLFCHLIDARHRNLEIDSNIAHFLESTLKTQHRNDYKIINIYTKADKLKKNELATLRHQNALTISTTKKDSKNLQEIYKAIITNSLGMQNP